MASHIVLRNRVWHYNRHVPDDVQPFARLRWWKESLKTGDKREAETKARAIAVQHDQFIAEIRNKPERQRLEELEVAAAALRRKIVDEMCPIEPNNRNKAERARTIRTLQQGHSLISDYTFPGRTKDQRGIVRNRQQARRVSI